MREVGYNWDDLSFVIDNKIPVVTFDEWDRGSMGMDVWPYPLHPQQLDFLGGLNREGIKAVHFVRKIDTLVKYPANVYPYEKCLYKDCDFPLTTQDELFSRPYEIFFYGNTTPRRLSVTNELSKHFNCDFRIAQKNLPQKEWLSRASQSKLFLTADGAGFTDERMQQLITIAPMLKQKNTHLQIAPFTDCVNCLMVSIEPTEEEIKGIKEVLNDKEYLYEIYRLGIEHAKKYYTEEWRALYILKVLKENSII